MEDTQEVKTNGLLKFLFPNRNNPIIIVTTLPWSHTHTWSISYSVLTAALKGGFDHLSYLSKKGE